MTLIRALYLHVKAKMGRFLIEGQVAGMPAEQACQGGFG